MKKYGMYTEAGNSAVAKIIECAETAELTWPMTQVMLFTLSTDERYGEAADTSVRECVYTELFGELQ
jgi:hypothetical protein